MAIMAYLANLVNSKSVQSQRRLPREQLRADGKVREIRHDRKVSDEVS
jgi:hypothetical protein